MNVKFKMPKFGRNLTGGGMVKELLLTILATTISIVLTFGTAHFLDLRQADQARRQTAMMLIHDIDESVAVLNNLAEGEEIQKAAIQYVIEHFDQIESLPEDTLSTAVTMMGTIFAPGKYFDESKEKVFNSGQETWKNLDDVSFVDNMESFYEARHYVETMISQSPQWKYPISEGEYYDWIVQIKSSNQSQQASYAALLKEKLSNPKIKYYIDCSSYRARFLRQYAQSWKRLSDRNKFIMNIDDEELAEYIKKSQRSGRTVSNSDIIGLWEYEMTGKDLQYYDFTKSGTFSRKSISHYANPFYSGDIIVTSTYGGKWDINGDSLTLNFSPATAKTKVDWSGVTYRAEMRDSFETFISKYFQEDQLAEMGRKQLESVKKITYAISINKAGDKFELGHRLTDDSGNESENYFYFKRSNKQ